MTPELDSTTEWVHLCVCSHSSGNITSKQKVQSQVQEKTEMLFEDKKSYLKPCALCL